MNSINFVDFYIRHSGDPYYIENKLTEDDVINVIIQKYQVILFTNKGDVFGDPNFGGDLLSLLYDTNVSANYVETILNDQISAYIPELVSMNYSLKAVFGDDPYNYQQMLFIYFQVSDYEVYAQISKTYGGF